MDLIEQLRKEVGEIEKIDLINLVTHRDFINGDVRLDQVYEIFKKNGHEYMAVINEGELLGLCSKTDVGFLLGSRFGFSVMGKKRVREHLISETVYLTRGDSIRILLSRVLTRSGKQFYEDVVLADPDGTYIGIIPVPYLVHLQTSLMEEKYEEMEIHHHETVVSLQRLEKSKNITEKLFENSAIGIVILDVKGSILDGNQKIREMLGGIKRDLFAGHFFSDWMVESNRGRYQRYFNESLADENITYHGQEFEFSLNEGKTVIYRVQFCRCSGRHESYLFIFDVTEQHEMERALVTREKTSAVESLVCGIAHELNNKLSPIMGLSEIMLMEGSRSYDFDEGMKDRLQTIYDTSKEAGIMIRQLQQLSHPMKPCYQECDVTDLLESVARMVRHSFAQEGIFYRMDVPAEKIKIWVDPSQMKQVFLNLILNSIYAMRKSDDKNLVIQVEVQSSKVFFTIQDSGEGIPEALIGKIFDPFFTTKRTYEGCGLGLSVCQSLVQNHHGVLTVSSEPGMGSLFRITLPRMSKIEVSATDEPARDRLFGGNEINFLRKSKILIVDDEVDICQMIMSALASVQDLSVVSAYSHEKAIDLLKMYRFDWVISDLRMPFYNGLDLYDWISSNQPYLKNRFILITGESDLSSLSKLVHESKLPVIRKPFSISKLFQLFRLLSEKSKPDMTVNFSKLE